MRLVLAVIASACSIAVLIDTPRRELEEELKQQWQEYRQHTGEIPAFPATSKNLQNSFQARLDTERYTAILHPSDARCGRQDNQARGQTMTTATLQNINEARETALNTMAADAAIASVWMRFASTCGPAIAKFDRAGGMHHATFLSRFPNEDAVNQWIESLES